MSAVKVLFSRNAKPTMLELDMASKENFLDYLTQFIFLIMKLLPGSVVLIATDMCAKSPITGEWI